MDIQKVKVHMFSGKQEIKTRNFGKVFDVYQKNGKYGIDWNTEKNSYMNHGEVFTPFESFAQTVIFEDAENGKLYHVDNIFGGLVEIQVIES